jgi:hypothetical protein
MKDFGWIQNRISGDARSSIESRRQSRTRSRYFRQCCTDIEFLPAIGGIADRYVQGQFFLVFFKKKCIFLCFVS